MTFLQPKSPFNVPFVPDEAFEFTKIALVKPGTHGKYSSLCQKWMESKAPGSKVLLTHSCTGALEMASILCKFDEGDEVIVPSYTFVSSAVAFVRSGAVPVFVDSDQNMNMTIESVEAAVTSRTKAIVCVHYAGNPCDIDGLKRVCKEHNLILVADCAHGSMATFRGSPLWAHSDLSTLSFHYTKNLQCGEGGALIINNPAFKKRAEVIWEKGTDRNAFLRGEVDKYTWRDIGSSFVMSEVCGAALYAQFLHADKITETRKKALDKYVELLSAAPPKVRAMIKFPSVHQEASVDGHMCFIHLPSFEVREMVRKRLASVHGVQALSHYECLHLSDYGAAHGRKSIAPEEFLCEKTAKRLLRLPMHGSLLDEEVQYICDSVISVIEELDE